MRRILIVDDIPEYVDTMEVYLEGYEVVKAYSLKEAEEKLKENVDAAIIDIRLNDNDPSNKDGLKLLEKIKKQKPDLPVIVTSAYKEFDYAVEALNIGADYFLKKPVNPNELKLILERLL